MCANILDSSHGSTVNECNRKDFVNFCGDSQSWDWFRKSRKSQGEVSHHKHILQLLRECHVRVNLQSLD